MGWWSRLGDKVVSGGASVGKKVAHGVSVGVKAVGSTIEKGADYVIDHSEAIKKVADTVGDVAGKVGNVAKVVAKGAESALPFTAEIPIVGEVVGGVAGLAEGVSGVSSLVGKGAKGVSIAAGGLTAAKKAGLIHGSKR